MLDRKLRDSIETKNKTIQDYAELHILIHLQNDCIIRYALPLNVVSQVVRSLCMSGWLALLATGVDGAWATLYSPQIALCYITKLNAIRSWKTSGISKTILLFGHSISFLWVGRTSYIPTLNKFQWKNKGVWIRSKLILKTWYW